MESIAALLSSIPDSAFIPVVAMIVVLLSVIAPKYLQSKSAKNIDLVCDGNNCKQAGDIMELGTRMEAIEESVNDLKVELRELAAKESAHHESLDNRMHELRDLLDKMMIHLMSKK